MIDEIQRAPEFMLAMKERMDADPTRGQFLVTGSANLLAIASIHDALPGRMIYLTLWPLSPGGDPRPARGLHRSAVRR